MKKIFVILRCEGCGKEINRTKPLKDMKLAKEIYNDALTNPLIGWCNSCNRKPFPKIVVEK